MSAAARRMASALLLGGTLIGASTGGALSGAKVSTFALGIPEARILQPASGKIAAPVVEIVGTSTDVLALGTDDYGTEIIDEMGGGVSVWIVLSKAGSDAFATMTEKYLGQSLEIYLCGELAYSASAHERIDSGIVVLAQGRTKAEAEEIVRRLQTGDCAEFDPQTLE